MFMMSNNNIDCTLGLGEMDSSIGEEGAKMDPEITEIELDQTDEEKETNKVMKSIKVSEPECNEATYQDPTPNTWSMFVGSSTVFSTCLPAERMNVADSLGSVPFRFSHPRKLFSYPATTKVSLVYEGSPEFPAVSICNFNRFKKSVIMANGYDQLLTQYERKAVFGLNT